MPTLLGQGKRRGVEAGANGADHPDTGSLGFALIPPKTRPIGNAERCCRVVAEGPVRSSVGKSLGLMCSKY